MRNTFKNKDSFESFEVDKNSLYQHGTDEILNPLIFKINNGRVLTDGVNSDCFITNTNDLISEITFSYKKGIQVPTEKNIVFQRYFLANPVKNYHFKLFSLLSGGGGTTNYYHWLFDTLPRLKILNESPYKNEIQKYLISDLRSKYKLETLSYLGIGPESIIDSYVNSHISAENVLVTTHPNSPALGFVPKWICQYLRKIFLTPQHMAGTKRILVSRKNATKRRISNEDLLFEKLEKLNFERIFLEHLSFSEQVKVFSESSIIVSPHGAGLANLVFSQEGAQIIEIYPPNSSSYIYESIAKNQQLQYSPVWGARNLAAENEGDLHADFSVDIDGIINLLDI
ncbi:MAG: glycosyltransferase family 61 protein [Flavobacteriaceae bacterium]